MIYIFFGIMAGVSIIVSRYLNFGLAKRTGLYQSTFFNYVTGIIFSIIILFVSGDFLVTSLPKFDSTSIIMYCGGLMGIVVVTLSSYMTPRMSGFYLTMFIFAGQLVSGIIIDYATLGIFSFGKVIGGALVFVGLIYNLNLDREI